MADAAPVVPTIPETAAPAVAAPEASAPPLTPASDAPAGAAATPTESPSLLASGDPGKRDGAPEPVAAAEPPVVEAKTEPPAQSGSEPPADAPKPAETPKPDATVAAPDALAPEPPASPVYDAYTFPEGLALDNERVTKFNGILGKAELTGKADHATMQALGQELVGFYHEEVQRIAEQVAQNQRDVWNRHKEGLINKLKADPDLGGNRIETTLGNAKYAYENMFGLDKTQQTELLQALDNAGVSDHPVFIRALHNLFERYREPDVIPANPPLTQRARERGQRGWYDTTDGAHAA